MGETSNLWSHGTRVMGFPPIPHKTRNGWGTRAWGRTYGKPVDLREDEGGIGHAELGRDFLLQRRGGGVRERKDWGGPEGGQVLDD